MPARERLPRTVWLLLAARTVNRLGGFSLPFLAVLISKDFGAGTTAAGLVTAAFGLATIPSRLIGGRLADRIGRRRTIVLGLSGCAVAQLGIAGAGSLTAAVVCAVLLGLAFEVYEPASQAMIADVVAPGQRVRAYSLFNAALAVGGMGAGLIAAWLGRWDLRWLFVADAVSCALCAVVMRIVLPDGLAGGRISEGAPAAGAATPAAAGRGAGSASPAEGGRVAGSAPAAAGRVAGSASPGEGGRAAGAASPAVAGAGRAPISPVEGGRVTASASPAASGRVAGSASPGEGGRAAGAASPAVAGAGRAPISPVEGGRVAGSASTAAAGRGVPLDSPVASGATALPAARVAPWRDRALLTLLASGTVFAVIYLQVMVSLPLALDRQGLQPADAGLLFTASALVVVAGQPLLRVPRVAALSDSGALALGYVLLGAGLAGYAVAGSPAAYLGATLVWGLGDLIVLGRAMALAAALAPPGGSGRYLAVYGTSWGAAQFAAPLAGTQLLERAGVSALWTVMAGACAVLAAAQLAVVRPLVEQAVRNGTSAAASACRPPVPSA